MKVDKLLKPGDVIVQTVTHRFFKVQEDTSEVKEIVGFEVLEWKSKALMNAFSSIHIPRES